MRKVFSIILIFIMGICLAGCYNNAPSGKNLKEISITSDGDENIITLSFVSGSYEAGYPEYKISKLPEYEVSSLSSPERIALNFHGLSFWDYTEETDWEYGIVQGIFSIVPKDRDTLVVYFQLSGKADESISEFQDSIQIKLTPIKDENVSVKYYCLSDAFDEYVKGSWPSDIPMTPVLGSDYFNKLLISEPFDTAEQANEFADKANAKLKSVLPDKNVYIEQIPEGSLPDSSYNSDTSGENSKVISKQGAAVTAKAVLNPGKLLAKSPDGSILYSKNSTVRESNNSEEYPSSEAIWIMDNGGKIYKPNISNFYSISKASYSYDGRYIGVLDTSFEDSTLYVYDLTKKTLINMGEEGLGAYTLSFAWSDKGDELYAIAGENNVQIFSCVFDQDGEPGIKTLRNLISQKGSVAVSGSKLFFSESGYDKGEIYEYGTPDRDITSGDDFIISPDGKYMLITETSYSDDGDVLTSLKLYDIQTGKSEYISEKTGIYGFCFSSGGGKVYYTVDDNEEEDYQYKIYSYDITGKSSALICSSVTGEIYAGNSDSEIYLVCESDGENDIYYKTYIYDLNQDGGQDAGND